MRYLAQCTIGRFNVDDEVKGLPKDRIAELLKLGAIEVVDGKPNAENPSEAESKKDD